MEALVTERQEWTDKHGGSAVRFVFAPEYVGRLCGVEVSSGHIDRIVWCHVVWAQFERQDGLNVTAWHDPLLALSRVISPGGVLEIHVQQAEPDCRCAIEYKRLSDERLSELRAGKGP